MPDPTTTTDPAEAAAAEVISHVQAQLAVHKTFSSRGGVIVFAEPDEVAAIIRRHMADRERKLVKAMREIAGSTSTTPTYELREIARQALAAYSHD